MTIYVGNLNPKVTEQELADLFTPFGAVSSAKIMKDPSNGNRSKGYGFVEMPNEAEATSAINELSEIEHGGTVIQVKAANESQPREQPGGRAPGSGGGGYRRN